MPLEPPVLDDRRFDDLVAEARSRIQRYTPEWTDHNLSDPGMTLVQLFAWLGEIILYRLNRVPEKNYVAFLKLIGIEQKPPVPARAELTFTLSGSSGPYIIIPKGTRVGAEAAPEPPSALSAPPLPPLPEEPLVFETQETLTAITAVLANVQVFDGANYTDYTEANKLADQHYYPFGRRLRPQSSILVGFSSDLPFPLAEINLAVRSYRDPSSVEAHECDLPGIEDNLPGNVVWEYWAGSKWRQLNVLKDETRALSQSGHVYFRGPSDIRRDAFGGVTEDRYWIRCRLLAAYYDVPPEIDTVAVNTVRALAVASISDEILGSSNGRPKQVFQLAHFPVYSGKVRNVEDRLSDRPPRPLNENEQAAADDKLREREREKGFLLEVDEGQGLAPWEEVEDFFNSNADDRHYILNRATGRLEFGDGAHGRIPVAGINNIVVRYYRYGGGARGNAGAGAIRNLQASITGVDKVTNLWPAEAGADEEPLEDTLARAPRELKARDRAVTAQDFEFLARQTPGVRIRRAHALPLNHPEFVGVEVPGVVTVMVIPDNDEPNPTPSEVTLKAVCEYLNERRLLTSELYVAPPKYTLVEIEATVVAKGSANPAQVKTDVETALRRYLHPLTGGADGQGWPIGGAVLYSEVFRVVLEVEGVERIDDLRIIIEGDRKNKCDDGAVPKDHIVYSKGHEVTVLTSL